MTVKISSAKKAKAGISSLMDLQRMGASAFGSVFLDSRDRTVLCVRVSPSLDRPKLIAVSPSGIAVGLMGSASGVIAWPIRLAPKSHVVTFQNEE